jgi:uncharacterized protein YndB with AHSA1/START domain
MTTHSSGDIAADARRLDTRTLPDGEEAQVMIISRTYDGDVAEIWDVVTNPERLPRWFLPVSGDLRVGGRYQLEGNAEGEVLTCEPPQAFSATWEYGGDVSWIEVELSPVDGGRTRLQLRHIARPNEHWKQYGPGAVGIGWDLALHGLSQYLFSGGEPVDPAAAAEWSASEEGRRFMTASSEGWYEADVARGTDPATARPAADRTLAFYTGDAEPEQAEGPAGS